MSSITLSMILKRREADEELANDAKVLPPVPLNEVR